jgi:uncharacterized repeat protein (TIGR03803 family)
MRRSVRYALWMSSAIATLAGCGGLQSPRSSPLIPSSAKFAAHRTHWSLTYEVFYSFKGRVKGSPDDGQHPVAGLVSRNGTFYGTTEYGGDGQVPACDSESRTHLGCGTVFTITPSGTESVLYRFKGRMKGDGAFPSAALVDVNGTLYGTTVYGGAERDGIVFAISPSGTETVLHTFTGETGDGGFPAAALLNVNGTLYGTTQRGGAKNAGTVFSITASGTETVLHSFGGSGDGATPLAGLINVKGTLYGTTVAGGTNEYGGTVFSITPSGKETVLYNFKGGTGDGGHPSAALINVEGKLYGTTQVGGTKRQGTVFSITASGTESVLHSFTGHLIDGAEPVAPLLNVNGTLYGTTQYGGANGQGTVFSITRSGKETVLHSFGGSGDGHFPVAGLMNSNGTLYGTTEKGGAFNGTIFALTP